MPGDPSSLVPMIRASGAISGVMGAYAILYPRAQVYLLIILIIYVTTISVPAILMQARARLTQRHSVRHRWL